MKPVLITAGATRNPIDSMRYISAHASGKTGATIARSLIQKANVTALCSPLAESNMPPEIQTSVFGSTSDLMEKMQTWIGQNPDCVVIHSAAVGDYEVQHSSTNQKIASGQNQVTLELKPTPKILDRIQEWSETAVVISFKAAAPATTTEELASIAHDQLLRTNSNMVFANNIDHIERGIMLVERDKFRVHETRERAIESLIAHILALIETP